MKSVFTKLTSLIALVCTFGTYKAQATHLAACDLWVVYKGAAPDGCSGTTTYPYEIVLTVYGACEASSIDVGSTQTVFYRSRNAGIGVPGDPEPTHQNGVDVPMQMDPRTSDGAPNLPDTVHSLCPMYDNSNSCKDDNNQHLPGYKRWRYRANVTLPSAQTDWEFWFTTGARNGAIVNLQTKNNMYIKATLNNFNKYNNSTAQFTSNPLPYICVNTNTTYLNGVYTPDGDSLRVVPQMSLQGDNNPDQYVPGPAFTPPLPPGVPPYSLSNPIASSTGYYVDSVTGTAYFTPAVVFPSGNGTPFVLAFRAEEYQWQTGVFLSSIMRDVQVSVLGCTAPPPLLDSLPSNMSGATRVHDCRTDRGFFIYACPGNDISLDLGATPHPSNPNNQVYMYADNNLMMPGSTFTVANDGTNNPKATFKWTPTAPGTYTMIVTASDSTCSSTQPIVLKKQRVYTIKVAPGLEAEDTLWVCQYEAKPTQLFVSGAECLKLEWKRLDGSAAPELSSSEIHNPVVNHEAVTKTEAYVISSPDLVGNCKSSETVYLKIDTVNSIDIVPQTPYVLCRPDYLQMDAVPRGPRPLTNFICGTANPIKCKPEDEIQLEIFGSPTYGKKVSYDTLGPTTPVFPNYLVRSSKQQYYISKGDLWAMGLRSSTITAISFDIDSANSPTHPYDNFTISVKCTNKPGLTKAGGFENFMHKVYTAPAETYFAKGIKTFVLDTAYTWDTTQNLIIEICYANNAHIDLCNQPTGTAPILRFVPTENIGTLYLKRFYTTPEVCGVITHDSIEARATRPKMLFNVCEANNVPFVFRWSALDPTRTDQSVRFLSDSTIQQPLAYVPKSITYYVESIGRSTCLLRDSISIYVPEHDYALIPKDTVICYGETAVMRVNAGFDFKWYEYINGQYIPATSVNCFNCRDVQLTPEVTTTYKVVVYDSVWCIDTLTTTVKVLPLPDIKIINNDTIIKYGKAIQLLASGAKLYNWTPVAPLNNANISYPIARPTESTEFVVGGIGANGCRAFDTVKVSVDTRDNLIIPSGFSPNGDGKNDLFRIGNLTFQRVLEFRVFNRWGQEIYNSNTNNGWDGTWKGQAQEVGGYSYQIRLAFPDGYVESYKGEVTLIR